MLKFNFKNSYKDLSQIFYTEVEPSQIIEAKLVVFNTALAQELFLVGENINKKHQQDIAKILSGQKKIQETDYIAQAYAGHQFGHPTILGDGRAIMLGEHVTPEEKRFDVQLKGAGRTPYSRGGDGKAALAPMLREYLISESMCALGISTSRSLAVVATDEKIYRETALPGAVLTRVAQSHIRVGTFEYAYLQNDTELLQQLLEYSVSRHFPELNRSKNLAQAFLKTVMDKQLDLIVDWMRVGFVHGVMNTDNMTISGETIDYGPCAFMDAFHIDTVFSSIDHAGRYAFGQQPNIAQWNLSVLAQCLLPLLAKDSAHAYAVAKEMIESFLPNFEKKWLSMMQKKLGLHSQQNGDLDLIKNLLTWMQKNKVDYTYTFYCLMKDNLPNSENEYDQIYKHKDFEHWYQQWKQRLKLEKYSEKDALKLMQKYNPMIIPRNYKVEEALQKAQNDNDLSMFKQMLEHLSKPYDQQNNCEYLALPPKPEDQDYVTYCGT